MKVCLEGKIYDSNEMFITLVLDDNEKDFISTMGKDAHKYVAYPSDMPYDYVKFFSDEFKVIVTKITEHDTEQKHVIVKHKKDCLDHEMGHRAPINVNHSSHGGDAGPM